MDDPRRSPRSLRFFAATRRATSTAPPTRSTEGRWPNGRFFRESRVSDATIRAAGPDNTGRLRGATHGSQLFRRGNSVPRSGARVAGPKSSPRSARQGRELRSAREGGPAPLAPDPRGQGMGGPQLAGGVG